MDSNLESVVAFLTELEQLKLVTRMAYVSDLSRHESSAEHSWHLALGLLTIARDLDLDIDLPKALRMALVHDVCEVDAGDISVYDLTRSEKPAQERACIERLAGYDIAFGPELRELWLEYEAQATPESRWVRVLDRLMPFIINLATQGRTWRDQSIARSQVLLVNEPIREQVPEVYAWLIQRVDECVAKGWLRDA